LRGYTINLRAILLLLNSKNEEARIEKRIHLYRMFCLDISHDHSSDLPASCCAGRNFIRCTGGAPAT
jgi:hypothetical protein